MMSAIETHFIVMDQIKEWWLNSADEFNEFIYRKILENMIEQEKYLEVEYEMYR